ncbi:uncharacterized protein RCO7_11526 [Rhynchosporium graminicola]|uniref:non-specific serine/threonine protein kinase n=1 Tax=Rhynchosporium graminicola TaxID=2792576 RepID=A0A1E1LDL3_9HELO|nr:uncharacterized protein RCO7_11526 [Rhynchosporium commune]
MSLLDDLNDYKLETSYQRDPECTIYTSYRADRARGIGKVAVIEKWVRDQKLLGVGTFGSVRLERRESSNARTQTCRAVKQMHKSHMARLKVDHNKEIIALTKFSRSKFSQSQLFVEFFGWFEDDDNVFLAMEYFELGTLDIHMTETLLEQDARSIALQLLEGLKIMHEEGFTHRDLKPENIFIAQKSPAWWVKIGDFGIAKRVSNNDTALQTATGTPLYLAPEVLHFVENEDEESSSYTNTVDIWSFACVVYQMMALQVPFPTYPRSLLAFCQGGPFPESPLLRRTSADGIEFIKSILVPFPTHRPTAKSVGLSKWLKDQDMGTSDMVEVFNQVNIRDDQTQSTKGALLPYREDQILSIPDQASGVPAQTTQARKLPALSSNKFPTPAIPILTPTTQVPTSVRLAKLMPSEAPSNFHANESERFVGSDTELSNLKVNSKFGRPPLPSGEHRSKPRNLPPISKDLPAGWKQRKAKDGKLYYVNSKTKKISSKFPKSS